MDPVTQGLLGAAAAQATMGRRLPRGAGLIGAVGGMIADLDILIHSASDPTVGWIYHRHFTHSLIFIPVGGLIAALPFLWRKEFRPYRREVLLAALIGYATHTPLDMLTAYGTQLFWPFSNHRVALDWIAIIDPIFTLLLTVGVFLMARGRRIAAVRLFLCLGLLYLCFGGWQHHRAMNAQARLAASRGHAVQSARVLPGFGSLWSWRSIYLSNGTIHVDGIRVPWLGSIRVLAGASIRAATIESLPAAARVNAEARRQFSILSWFADGWLARVGDDPHAIGDIRYTIAVESLTPLWGLTFDPTTGAPRRWSPAIAAQP